MGQEEKDTIKESCINILNHIMKNHYGKIYQHIKKNQINPDDLAGFVIKPDQFTMYIGRQHIAIEYDGPETANSSELTEQWNCSLEIYDFFDEPCSESEFFEKIIGFKFDSTSKVKIDIPLEGIVYDLVIPTNAGADKLEELHWNYAAQDSIIGYNTSGYYVPKGKFARLINCVFFDADKYGLLTRRIKVLDFIPIADVNEQEHMYELQIEMQYYDELWKTDIQYKLPQLNESKLKSLQMLNRFIELAGNRETTEPTITSFLARTDTAFILGMAFFAKNIYPEKTCNWQSEEREDIKPDFFVEATDGYANIVEFKLPCLKHATVVGRSNRESFSAEIYSYISQTRVYKDYFDDPNNRKWFEKQYGFKVYSPKRILVVGRRHDFSSDAWREIKADFAGLEILTYDDLIDGVMVQLYR